MEKTTTSGKLISILTKDSGRTHFTTKETNLLQEISYLEGRNDIDKLNKKIKEFKSGFVLTENEWISGINKNNLNIEKNK